MRKMLFATVLAGFASLTGLNGTASAQTIGVSFHVFDDNFITVLRNGMIKHAETLPGVKLQVENAQGDVGRQLDQIKNFIAAGVNALVVLPVDTSGATAITELAAKANIPLVYVNREPNNVDSLPKGEAFIASNELDSGTLETKEVCRLLHEKGVKEAKVAVLVGQLGNFAAKTRTQDIKNVIATPDCSFMKIVDEQSAGWQRVKAADIVTNWVSSGLKFDAIIANNDEMAIGAIQALKASGQPVKDLVIAGIDATKDGLAAMADGSLKVTVFQDAAGQGAGGVDAALALLKGTPLEKKVYIPFQLVTPANMATFANRN